MQLSEVLKTNAFAQCWCCSIFNDLRFYLHCVCVYIPCFLFLHIGYQHLKEVIVCDCESHAVTLVRCQFWPGSPERPSVGVHFKLIDLAEKLFLHSQVSVKKFSELILEMTPLLQPNFVSSFIITVVFFIRPVFFNILIDFLV